MKIREKIRAGVVARLDAVAADAEAMRAWPPSWPSRPTCPWPCA
jgi:hypothetical protein